MAKHFQSKDNQSSSSNTRKAAAAHVQAKMKVGQKNDTYEKEADHAAEKVTAQSASKSDKGGAPVVGRISKLSSDFGKSAQKQEVPKEAAKEEKKPVQKMEEKEPAQKMADKEEKKPVQKMEQEDKKEAVQKQEDEESQSKVQKMEEKEPAQKMADEEEKKPVQKMEKEDKKEAVQKQEDEESQSKVQKMEEKEEKKPVQKMEKEDKKEAVQKQEEEESQSKVQKMEEQEAQAKTEPRANVRDKQKYPVLNSVEPKLLASKGKGEPLPDEIRIWLESRFGADFGKVRIHTGGYAIDMAREMEAQAFTNGSDIYFNDGKFDPDSISGKLLLAHELTHVIQQNKAEQKLSAEKIAESNAARNAPLPAPPDKDAKKTKEEIEKAKKEAAAAEMKKTEKQKKGPKKPKVKSTAKVQLNDKKEEKEGDKKMGKIALFMKKMSKARVSKKMRKLATLAARQKKKDDAKTKLEQSQKSVVPPAEESQSKANASQVDTVNQSKEPKPDEQKAKQAFNEAMDKAVPSSLEAMDKFKEEGKGQVVGEQVRGTVTADTQEVQGTYQEIENTPEPAPAETPDEMPPIEATPETSAINMGEDVIGEVQPEHTDMSEFSDKADKTMEDEEISDDQLEMVDSGPLAEAKEDKKQLKNKVETGPKEVKELENQKKKEVSQEMKKEEMKGKKQMKAKRKKELNNTKGKQKNTKKTIEQKRQAVTDHINGIYKTTNDKVKKKLEDLEKQSLKAFDDGQAAATKLFENNVKRRLDSFKSDRYSGMFGWARWLKDKLLGMEDLPAVKAIFDSEKANFIANIDRLIAKITADNKKVIQECKDMVQKAREDIAKYVSKLGPELRDVGKKAQADMQKKLDALDETVNKKAEELKKKLDEKREAAIKAIEEKIDSMKSEMSGLAGKLAALLLGALIKFFTWAIEKIGGSSDKIMGVVNKSKKVIKTIVKSPGKFIGNLGKAVKQGFALFQTNFTKHLMGGIVEWLTGAMGGTGITMPEKFDLKGVMSVGLQVLGLTWEQIREKIAKRVGEPVLAAAEKGLDIIVQIKEKGFIVLWDMLVEKAQELKDKVMESISGWAVVQIVKSAITKLLTMLNPAGAILQIALTIYDGVMWFIENMQRIMDFIMSIFNSIAEIAFGQLGKAAGFIEAALAKIIPIILSFLARWLKLSGVGKAIKKAVKKVRDPIDKVLVKIINFVVGKIKKLFGKKGKKKKDDKKKGGADMEIGETVKFKAKKGGHKLYFKKQGKKAKLMVASTPKTVDDKLDEWKKSLKEESDYWSHKSRTNKKTRIIGLINESQSILSGIDGKARQAISVQGKDAARFTSVDNEIESKEKTLSTTLKKLYDEFGQKDKIDFKVVYATDLNKNHPKAKQIIDNSVDTISEKLNKDKKALSEIQSWSGLRKKLEVESNIDKLVKNPLKNGKAYENFAKQQIENAGKEELKENYTDKKRDDLILSISQNNRSHAFIGLREQIFDKSKEGDTTGKIKKAFRGESGEHALYKPKNLKFKIENGNTFVAEYDYDKVAEDKGGKKDFTVRFKLLDGQARTVEQSTTGRNLVLKDPGSRGRTASSGKLTKDKTDPNLPEIHSAHVLADVFMGSGYRNALNLIATSDKFNTETMWNAESTIKKGIEKIESRNTDKIVHFNLVVSAKWEALKDDKVIEALKKVKAGMTKEELKETSQKLSAKQDPRRVIIVNYNADVFVEGVKVRHLKAHTTNEDTWLDKAFGK